MRGKIGACWIGALAGFVAVVPTMSGQATAGSEAPLPFVEVSLLGGDVIFRPERISYRVVADPGSYVTVILISPLGQRTVLNPYEDAVEGGNRKALIREAWTGNRAGESYLVAIATRNRSHSTRLLALSRSTARVAATSYGAEGSLNDFLTGMLPAAGEDFSVAYVSFRLLSGGVRRTLAFNTGCYNAVQFQGRTLLRDDFYGEGTTDFDESWIREGFAYPFTQTLHVPVCDERLFGKRALPAAVPVAAHPVPAKDTAGVQKDSAPNPATPFGPRIHHPVAPRPLDVQPLTETSVRAAIPARELHEPVVPRSIPVSHPAIPMERREPMLPPPPPPPTQSRSSATPLPDAAGTRPTIPPPIRL